MISTGPGNDNRYFNDVRSRWKRDLIVACWFKISILILILIFSKNYIDFIDMLTLFLCYCCCCYTRTNLVHGHTQSHLERKRICPYRHFRHERRHLLGRWDLYIFDWKTTDETARNFLSSSSTDPITADWDICKEYCRFDLNWSEKKRIFPTGLWSLKKMGQSSSVIYTRIFFFRGRLSIKWRPAAAGRFTTPTASCSHPCQDFLFCFVPFWRSFLNRKCLSVPALPWPFGWKRQDKKTGNP